MKYWCILLTAVLLGTAGCNMDIVSTEHLTAMTERCVYVEAIGSEDPQVGEVLKDILQKELLRKNVAMCDEENATIIMSGATFMTNRSVSKGGLLGSNAVSNQALESISLTAKNKEGQILLSASYDNGDRKTAGKVGKEFGTAIANRLR